MRLNSAESRKPVDLLAGTLALAGLLVLGCTEPAALVNIPILEPHVLARASADECFAGVGEPYPPGPPCAEPAREKINEAYVWGLTETEGKYFFGTAANVHCLVQGGFLSSTAPQEVPSWVCEFGESPWAKLGFPAAVGDWRPPTAHVYDTQDASLTELTPADPIFTFTLGVRSAGSHAGVAFLAGPDLLRRGINVFAWDAATNEYLGSHRLTAYTDIRQWLVHGDVLYTAVGGRSGGGRVLRWTGNLEDPFQFEEVGELDGDGANLSVYHSGGAAHLAVTTWPSLTSGALASAALWISPPLPEESGVGLGPEAASHWRRVWSITEYEPDPVVALVLGGGATAYFDGWLYWGTMVVPGLAPAIYALIPDGPLGADPEGGDVLKLFLRSWRALTLFRGRGLETDEPEIELLYGEEFLSVFDTDSREWELTPNKMNAKPLYGRSGFGNPYNNYTWVAGVAQQRLFIGTMDWSYLMDAGLLAGLADALVGSEMAGGLRAFLEGSATPSDEPSPLLSLARGHGADLWRFSSSHRPAMPEDVRGLGNRFNYGLRSLVAEPDKLVIGTANPMNLETEGLRHGGWELVELTPRWSVGRLRPALSR